MRRRLERRIELLHMFAQRPRRVQQTAVDVEQIVKMDRAFLVLVVFVALVIWRSG